MSQRVTVADGFAQLVGHVFAHIPLEQPGNLHDRRYVAWSREAMTSDARAMLEHDAALIASHWRSDRRLDVLNGVLELHGDLDEFRRTAARPIAELEAHDVRSPRLLALLQQDVIAPVAELLHATFALLVDELAALLASLTPQLEHARARIDPFVRRLDAIIPGFEHARVELVWALGVHGRAFPERILVGAPVAWCGCSPARQAVLAAHEYLVRSSHAADYLGSEWDALVRLARELQRASDPELRDAHAQWLAELDLATLLEGIVGQDGLTHDRARALLEDPPGRAHRLASQA
jgi:hypothetical protein